YPDPGQYQSTFLPNSELYDKAIFLASPLFNLAIEPPIQAISNSSAIGGVPLGSKAHLPPVKVMVYVDDSDNLIRTA
ncbi:hypothetical protein BGZ83_002145, partial [Gryganskiella cystojenkinii]